MSIRVHPWFSSLPARFHPNRVRHSLLRDSHPDRPKMNRFSAKLRNLGLHEETIGYGPSKEKWEAFQLNS